MASDHLLKRASTRARRVSTGVSKEGLFAIDPESAFYPNGPEAGKDEIS